MLARKDLTNEIIDEAMSQILSGVDYVTTLRMLMRKYKTSAWSLIDLLDIATDDAMNYVNDMNNYSRYTDE